jgi:hypothetical protein
LFIQVPFKRKGSKKRKRFTPTSNKEKNGSSHACIFFFIKTKPPQTKEIEGGSDLVKPEDGAKRIIRGLEGGYFVIPWSFFPEDILRMLGHGIALRDTPLIDLFLTPILVFIAPLLTYLSFDAVVLNSKKAAKKRD